MSVKPLLILVLCGACAPRPQVSEEPKTMSKRNYAKPSAAQLERRLTRLQFQVTQHDATEPPFQNAYWDHHGEGLYVDVVTGEPLFSSRDKFESGTGWPSFTRPLEEGRVVERRDVSHGMVRVEVRSRAGDSHLGHLFDDGPAPTGQRYCINSASLRFVPAAKLAEEGYPEYAMRFTGPRPAQVTDTDNACAVGAASCEPTLAVAVLAGGCFWGMEEILRKVPGVVDTEVGYAGGSSPAPRYHDVKTGRTGHAEAIRVVFDPKQLSYAELLETWFFRMHDPTTRNRQGNDVGTQYRSAIFVADEEQRKVAAEVKAKVEASGRWKRPIVTEIVSAGQFTPAEDDHQDYLAKHPGGYTCHYLRD
jgi:peptide methionine sulfoxide reductase msrA/msrB